MYLMLALVAVFVLCVGCVAFAGLVHWRLGRLYVVCYVLSLSCLCFLLWIIADIVIIAVALYVLFVLSLVCGELVVS